MEKATKIWQPRWTTSVKIESGGRYPLGLNRFHKSGLEEILIKSITLQANRLRYYTYCCWAIGDIERREPHQNGADFVSAFQKRETALAIGLYLLDSPAPGSDNLAKVIDDDAEKLACDFSIMKSNVLGAFGLYYSGTSYTLGLVENNENGVITLTATGQKLYDFADKRYQRLKPAYYTQYRGRSLVPTAVLREWGEVNKFDNICDPDCQAEQEFFQSLLYRLNQANPSDYRRDTLAFFLTCIAHCETSGVLFTEDVLSHIHTYRSYWRESNEVVTFAVPDQYQDVHFYWAIYEGHAYFRGWLSRLFQIFLNYLKGCAYGGTVADFLGSIDITSFNQAMTHFCGIQRDWWAGSIGEILECIGGPPELIDPFSEAQLKADSDYETLSGIVAKFVLVMADLWQRFREARNDQRYQYVTLNLSSDLWFNVLFQIPTLPQMTVHRFLHKMLKAYVLDQHDRIMMEKNDLRRCWFTTEQGRYFFQSDATVIWRPAKYSTIMHFLEDMNLIEQSVEEQWQLTAQGQALLQRLERGV